MIIGGQINQSRALFIFNKACKTSQEQEELWCSGCLGQAAASIMIMKSREQSMMSWYADVLPSTVLKSASMIILINCTLEASISCDTRTKKCYGHLDTGFTHLYVFRLSRSQKKSKLNTSTSLRNSDYLSDTNLVQASH